MWPVTRFVPIEIDNAGVQIALRDEAADIAMLWKELTSVARREHAGLKRLRENVALVSHLSGHAVLTGNGIQWVF
jgi:hypothetical protein